MVPRLRMWTSALLVTLTSGLASAGNVITVDDSGPAHFAQIQPAVDAAVDGDTILVKPGSYTGFTIDGKALTVVGDDGALPTVSGRIWIKNIAVGSTLSVARLKAQGLQSPASAQKALTIASSPGAIRIVGCELTGAPGTGSFPTGRQGIELTNATDIAFAACTIAGGNGWFDFSVCTSPPGNGGAGFLSQSSMIALYDCDVRGGRGGTGNTAMGAYRGGDAITLSDDLELGELLFASRSHIEGGGGGITNCLLEDPQGGDGGHGLTMGGTLSVHLLDDTVLGGFPSTGGNPFRGGIVTGTSGTPIVGGPPFQYVVSSLELSLPAVARAGTFLTLTFAGDPGDHVYLNDELTTTFALVPSWRGVVIAPFPSATSGPARARRWGVIPASGVLTQVYRAPALPAGVEAQTRFLQAYRIRANGLTLGSFATLTVLDSSL